jgi:hypothetical protein
VLVRFGSRQVRRHVGQYDTGNSSLGGAYHKRTPSEPPPALALGGFLTLGLRGVPPRSRGMKCRRRFQSTRQAADAIHVGQHLKSGGSQAKPACAPLPAAH